MMRLRSVKQGVLKACFGTQANHLDRERGKLFRLVSKTAPPILLLPGF